MKTDALRALYDEGYFHGANSGYPPEGYECGHMSWEPWIALLRDRLGEGRLWLDVGCAYGYLVDEASFLGFRALGVDVSEYALRWNESLRGKLLQALAEALPFPDGAFDVVSAFDLLEHLERPEAALSEIARVLRTGGVLIGGTPDPEYFSRHEETHVSERPPGFWLSVLRALGFEAGLRFHGAPYNLEFLAVKGEGDGMTHLLGHDFLGKRSEILQVGEGLAGCRAALRAGWGPWDPEHAARAITAGKGVVYLWSTRPVEVSARAMVAGSGPLPRGALWKGAPITLRRVDDRVFATASFALGPDGGNLEILGEGAAIEVLALEGPRG